MGDYRGGFNVFIPPNSQIIAHSTYLDRFESKDSVPEADVDRLC